MKGLVVKYGEKTYKVGLPDGGVTLSSCIMQNKFTLEAGGSGHAYASVFLKLREDIEFEVEVAEFDKASEPLSETNQPIIDPDYPREEDPDWKLKHFRKLEKILKDGDTSLYDLNSQKGISFELFILVRFFAALSVIKE